MMAGLFALYTAVFITIYYGKRKLAIALIVLGLILSFAMLWHHATSQLQIKW
jgi:uncharacterized membrane protein